MKKVYFILTLLGLTFISLKSQTFGWAKVEGLYAYDYGMGISTDNTGNVYVAGKYEMNAIFSGTTLPCTGSPDCNHNVFVAKYNPSGALTWIRTAGGSLGDYAHALSCDGANVYVAGEIEGAGELITFPGSTITLTAIGDNDVLLAKYDLDGNLLWAKNEGGPNGEEAEGVTYDAAGNIYVSGYYVDQATFGGVTTLSGSGSKDAFIAKYDMNGNFQWVRKIGGPGREQVKGIKADAAGNIYACGLYGNNVVIGSTTYTTYNNTAYSDAFLLKYDTNGNLQWTKTAGGNYDDVAWAITMDNAGLIYISGEFNDVGYFGSAQVYTTGNADVFVACYDQSGNVQWVKSAGGPLIDRARGIGTDGTNIFITGQFGGTANFGSNTLVGADSSEVFFAGLNNSGTFVSATSVGGTSDTPEPLGYESGNAICSDASGNVYATGALLSGGVFGSTSLSKYDRTDAFVTKISQLVGVNTIVNSTKAIYIYPNPGNGNFVLEMEQLSNAKSEIVIYNCLGQAIHRKTNNSASKINFDLSNEENGIYFIEIKKDDKVIATKKIIIQK
jgi:hypothetical protein